MAIDYLAESEKYRPLIIKTLLVGEAPPPSGTRYFYVPQEMSMNRRIEDDTSLPATIFHHYFGVRPRSKDEYRAFLCALRDNGIFLVDICDAPIKVRGDRAGLERIAADILLLTRKLQTRGIVISEDAMVFLLARKTYAPKIRHEFPKGKRFTWKEFRTTPEEHLLPCPS